VEKWKGRDIMLSTLLGDIREMPKKLNPTKGVTPWPGAWYNYLNFQGIRTKTLVDSSIEL